MQLNISLHVRFGRCVFNLKFFFSHINTSIISQAYENSDQYNLQGNKWINFFFFFFAE